MYEIVLLLADKYDNLVAKFINSLPLESYLPKIPVLVLSGLTIRVDILSILLCDLMKS